MICIDEKTQLLHDRLTRIENMLSAVINRLDDPAYVVKMPNRDDIAKRMENASKDDEINRRIATIGKKSEMLMEITNGLCSSARKHDVKLGNLTSALNDLHSRLADIEGNAVLIQNGVIVPVKKG